MPMQNDLRDRQHNDVSQSNSGEKGGRNGGVIWCKMRCVMLL